MSYSTIYDVRVRYSVDNRAARSGTQGLTEDVRKLGKETSRTSGMFGRLGATVVGYFGARAAGKAFLGFNATVQDTKNQIAGMLALSKKTDLSDQVGRAEKLYTRLQIRAKSLPGTTQEYVSMLGMLTQPLSAAGATMKDMEDITVNAVVGAKALGVEWQAAARDIDQALRGQYHSTDVFTGKLLGAMGYGGEEGRAKFNALDAGKRADIVKAALTQKQLTQLAAAQGQTFNGQLSTLQDTIEQFLGKVGLPLFKAITNELKHWNAWIDSNQEKVEQWADKLGGALVDGFRYVKDVLTFMVDHRELFMTMAKVWLAVKVGQGVSQGVGTLKDLLGGSAGNGGTGLKGLAGWFRGSRDSYDKDGNYSYTAAGRGRQAVGGMGGVVDNAGKLAASFGTGYAIGQALNDAGMRDFTRSLVGAAEVNGELLDVTDKTTRQFAELQQSTMHLDDAIKQASKNMPNSPSAIRNLAGGALDARQKANLVGDMARALKAGDLFTYKDKAAAVSAAGITEADINKAGGAEAYARQQQMVAGKYEGEKSAAGIATFTAMTVGVAKLTEYQRKTLETELAQEDISRYMVSQLAAGKLINPDTVMEILRRNTQDPSGKHKDIADKPKVNVTIQRIEVQSDDPDRMAFGLLESFRDAAKNPSSALSSLREG